MINRKGKILLVFFGMALLFFGYSGSASAAVVVTPATGGSAISADTNVTNGTATWTTLVGPTITESTGRALTPGSGTIIFSAPAGYQFNTGANVTATITLDSGGTCFTFSSNTVTPATSTITYTIATRDSNGATQCHATFSNIQVRPTAGNPLAASGSITNTGSNVSVPSGATNYGTLTEIAGAKNKLVFTTQPSATATTSVDFTTKPVVKLQDQYGNTETSDSTSTITRTAVLSTQVCGGTLGSGTLSSTPANGAAITAGVMTYTAMQYSAGESIKICAASAGVTSALSNTVTVNPAIVGTSITVGSSGSPSVYGNSVTFTATVTPAAGGPPTGTVTFKDGATTLGTGTLNGATPGVATFATTTLNVSGSPHSITAVYGGSGSFSSSTSSAILQTITTKTLTVTGITANNKVYNATTSATLNTGSAVLVGIVSGDTVTLNTASTVANFSDKNVGAGKTVTVSGLALSGASASNYSLTQPTGITASITAASLTVTGIAAANKAYDATTTATLSGGSLVGVLGADVVSLATRTGSFVDKNVGVGKTVTVTALTLTGTDAGNYTVTLPSSVTASITAASLTVTGVTASDKIYNGNATTTINTASAVLVGVTSGDIVTLNATFAVGSFANKNVGVGKTVTVSGLALGGADGGNYSLTQPTASASITTATLTVSGITASDKTYDGNATATLNVVGASLVGVFGSDVVTLNTASAIGIFATSSVGTGIVVTVSGLLISGTDASNYSLTQPTTTASINNAVPTTTSLSPSSVTAGGSSFTLTIRGTNFVSGSSVQINSSPRATLFASSSQLTATILAADIATAGTASITVVNGAPGGGTSNAQTLTIISATTKFVIVPPTSGTVDAPISVTVQAERADNTVDTTYQNDVTLNVGGSATGGGVVDIVNGVGTKPVSDIVAQTVLLSLTDSQNTGLNVTSTSTATFAPGAITQFSLNHPGTIAAGTRAAYEVKRKDQFSNLVTSGATTVYLYANSTSSSSAFYNIATGGTPITSVSVSNGTSSASFWYTNDPGTWTVTASDNATSSDGAAGIADANDSLAITATATRFLVIPAASSSVAGSSVNVQIKAQDGLGNIATTFSGSVTLTTTGNATGGGVITITNGIGSANVNDNTAETITIGLLDTQPNGLNASSTASLTFVPGAVSQFSLNHPGNMSGGARLGYSVTRKDQFANLVSSASTTVYLYSNSTSTNKAFFDAATGGNQITSIIINSGNASTTFWYYDDLPGARTVTASDNATSADGAAGIADAVDSFTVVPGATKFIFANVPSSAVVGSSVTFNIYAVDSFNNIDTSAQQGVTLTTTGSASAGGLVSIINGVGTTTVSDTVAQTVNLGLQDTQFTGLNASSTASLTFVPGAVSQFSLNHPGNMNGNTRLGYTLLRKDQYGNLVTSGDTVAYLYSNSTSTDKAFFAGATGGTPLTSITIPGGNSSVGFWYFETLPGTWTVTASDNATSSDGAAGIADAADTFTVAPGAVRFSFAATPTGGTAGDTVSVSVFAVDSFGNIDTTFSSGVTVTKTGSASGGGLITLASGVGTVAITDLTAETVTLGFSDTQSTGLGVTATKILTFTAAPVTPSTGGGATPTPVGVAFGTNPVISLTFSGYAYPGTSISVIRKDQGLLQSAVVQQVAAAKDGSFLVKLNNVLRLTGQTYLLSFTDKDGRVAQTKAYSAPALDTFVQDNIVVAPTVGFESQAVVTMGGVFAVTGYATPGATLQIFVDGISNGTVTVNDATGNYRYIVSTDGLVMGRHSISVRQVFKGIQSDFSNQKSFTVSPLLNPRVDLNGDGVIDIKDASIFLSYLKDLGAGINRFQTADKDLIRALDLNGNGTLDLGDFSILLQAIGAGRPQ